MTFAGYMRAAAVSSNRLKPYGDPRDRNIDAWIGWNGFHSETRNDVQRAMENLQVYRVRSGTEAAATAKPDQHRGTTQEVSSVSRLPVQPSFAREIRQAYRVSTLTPPSAVTWPCRSITICVASWRISAASWLT